MAVLGAVELTLAVAPIAPGFGFGGAAAEVEVRVAEEDLTSVVLVSELVVVAFNVVDLGAVALLANVFTSPLSVVFLSPAAVGFGDEIKFFGFAAVVVVRRGVIFGAVELVFGTGAALKADDLLAELLVVCFVSNCFGLDTVPVVGFLAVALAVIVRAVFVGDVGTDFVGAFDDVVFVVDAFVAVAFFVATAAAAVAATAAPLLDNRNNH